jgi:hypothetical protein
MNPMNEYVVPFRYQSIKWIKVVKQNDYYRVTLINFHGQPMFDTMTGIPYERDGIVMIHRGPVDHKVMTKMWEVVMTYHKRLTE